MKKTLKKTLAVFLTLVMLVGFIPLGKPSFESTSFDVKAADVTFAEFQSKLNTFKSSVYKHNSTYVDNPSATGGYQCFGFANELAKYIFGSYPTSSMDAKTVNSKWQVTYGGNAVDSLCVGDIVRYLFHSIFITKIDGDNIYYCQANSPSGTNRVTYDNVITRNNLKNNVSQKLTHANATKTGWVAHFKESKVVSTPVLTINYHANGGNINSNIIGNKYIVSDSDGLNMRSGPGMGYSKITAFTKGTTFTVNVGDTQSDGTYTWGKTTCNGYTGWVVISDFVTHQEQVRDFIFYLENSYVFSTALATKAQHKIEYGITRQNGLANNEYLGLYKENYNFLGWSLSIDGSTTIFTDSIPIKAEEIYPNIKNGSAEITLYAVWEEKVHIHTPGASATCTINQTCTSCGTVLTYATGHTPGASATCTTNQTCISCGTVLTYATVHTPGASATCTSNQTCTSCGTVLTYATGHTTGASATCTSNQTCISCGTVLTYATGHTPGASATCTTNQTCTSCGTVINPMLEHSYNADQYVSQKHPHTIYYVCECGAIKDSGLTETLTNCDECDLGIKIKITSKYQITENFLKRVTVSTNVSALIENFENEDLEIFSSAGTKLNNSDICSTGCIVLCPSSNERLIIIISGDVDGNGTIDSTDYLRIKGGFLGTYSLDETSILASDVDQNGQIDTTDYLRVKGHFLGTYNMNI